MFVSLDYYLFCFNLWVDISNKFNCNFLKIWISIKVKKQYFFEIAYFGFLAGVFFCGFFDFLVFFEVFRIVRRFLASRHLALFKDQHYHCDSDNHNNPQKTLKRLSKDQQKIDLTPLL
jgi:hypothetical protein